MKKKVNRTTKTEPTESDLAKLEKAKAFFNQELWPDTPLPPNFFLYQRKPHSRGHFHKRNMHSRSSTARIDEISLNPDCFPGHTDEEILSTLVHEMCHQWRSLQDGDPASGYHDRVWSREMYRIGLNASHTGKAGGKPNGYHMDHFIMQGGKYQQAYAKLAATGLEISWQSNPQTETEKKKTESKTKYTCATCGANAWGKPDLKIYHCFPQEVAEHVAVDKDTTMTALVLQAIADFLKKEAR